MRLLTPALRAALLVLGTAAAQAQAGEPRWSAFDGLPNSALRFDARSLEVDGDRGTVTAWVRRDRSPPDTTAGGVTYDRLLLRYRFECRRRLVKTLHLQAYMGSQPVSRPAPGVIGRVRAVVPDTVAERMWLQFCEESHEE